MYKEPQNDSIKVIPMDCTIDVVSWHPKYPDQKWPNTFYVRGGQVSGTFSNTQSYQKWCRKDWCCSPQLTTGVFHGSLMDNVITGTWEMKGAPHSCWYTWTKSTKGADGKYTRQKMRCTYTMSYTSSLHSTITLGMNGRLKETYSGTNHSSTTWGPGCYEKYAGTTQSYDNSFSWNDPDTPADMRKPMVGIWELRKRPPARETQDK